MFKKRKTYRVILKSGADFYIKATNIKIEYKRDTLELTKYSFEGVKKTIPFYLSPLEIVAILEIR